MPRSQQLSIAEKAKIDAYRSTGMGYGIIAKNIGRSKCCVEQYIKKSRGYGTKKRSGRPSKVSARDQRRIVNAASNSAKSAREIAAESGISVSKNTICRILKRSQHIVRAKKMPAPRMTASHKEKRLDFAKNEMARDWSKVSFVIKE